MQISKTKTFYYVLATCFALSTVQVKSCFAQFTAKPTHIDSLKKITLKALPANYYSSQLGIMCKKELQLEKAIKVPLKIRLGTLEQVDKLEGKKRY